MQTVLLILLGIYLVFSFGVFLLLYFAYTGELRDMLDEPETSEEVAIARQNEAMLDELRSLATGFGENIVIGLFLASFLWPLLVAQISITRDKPK